MLGLLSSRVKKITSALLIVFLTTLLTACGGGGGGGGSDAPPATGSGSSLGGGSSPAVTAPSITTQPQNQTVNDGVAVRFIVSANGTAPFAIQWKRNSIDIPGANSAFYDMAAVSIADDGAQLSATISNSAGSATSSTAVLNVSAVSPRIITAPQPQTVLAGTSATFTAAVTGTPPLNLQWRRNGAAIAGANSSSYTTPLTAMIDTGSNYELTVSNTQGLVVSQAVILHVTPVPNAVSITTQPADISITEGTAATFTVAATGTGPFTYQWLRNGSPIPGGYESTLSIAPVTFFDNANQFSVEVSNTLGTSTSSSANLSVTAGALSLRLGSTGGWGDIDSVAELARFGSICGVTVDNAGNYFVTDTVAHTVRKISSTKTTTTVAGLSRFEGSADGIGSSARFKRPGAIATDSIGNIFIIDTANQTVRWMWAGGSGLVTTLAGNAGSNGAVNGTGSAARFNFEQNPLTCSYFGQSGIAVDSSGNIYVADSNNHAIRKITAPNGVVTTFAGTLGQPGSADGISANARFNHPTGLAFDTEQNLYVVDRNAQLRKISPAGEVTSLPGNKPTSDGALLINNTGEIFLTSYNAIYRYDTSGIYSHIAGAMSSFIETNGTGLTASFDNAAALALGPGRDIIIADHYGLRRLNAYGQVSTFAGNLGPVYGFSDGAANTALVRNIGGIETDPSGNVYFADLLNNTVRKLSAAGMVTTIAGVYQQAGADDGTLVTARFNNPKGIARDTSGNLYVSDRAAHTVRKIAANGTVTTIAGASGITGSTDGTAAASRLNTPGAVAVDASGNVYVVDEGNYVIRKINTSGAVSTLAGLAGVSGGFDGSGNVARFSNLHDIEVDSAGNLFVIDSFAIRKINSAGATTTFAGSSSFGTGDGTGAAARFSFPSGITIDNVDNLFVTDGGNNGTIRKITPTGVVTTVAGSAGVWGIQLGSLPGSFDAASSSIAILPSTSGTKLLLAQGPMLVQITLP